MLTRLVCLALLAFLPAAGASAQAIVQVNLQIASDPPGVGTWAAGVLIASVPCNQVPPPVVPSPVVAPTKFVYDDVGNPGRVCIGVIPPALLAQLPVGAYTMTLAVLDDLGRSSAASDPPVPFVRAGLLSVRTGLRLTR